MRKDWSLCSGYRHISACQPQTNQGAPEQKLMHADVLQPRVSRHDSSTQMVPNSLQDELDSAIRFHNARPVSSTQMVSYSLEGELDAEIRFQNTRPVSSTQMVSCQSQTNQRGTDLLQVISLADCLPAYVWKPDPKHLCSEFERLFSACKHMRLNATIPSWNDMHAFTKLALSLVPAHDSTTTLGGWANARDGCIWHIYTDGSFTDEGCTWGLVVVLECQGHFEYHGYSHGYAVNDPDDPRFVGAVRLNNYTAEVVGIMYALALVFGMARGSEVRIQYDCVAAAHMATTLGDARVEQPLIMILRNMHALACSHAYVTYHHVKGHSGQPWNEMADRACAHVAEAVEHFGFGPAVAPLLAVTQHEVWSAIDVYQGLYSSAAYPRVVNGEACITMPAPPALPHYQSMAFNPSSSERLSSVDNQRNGGVRLTLVQCNVLTMAPSQISYQDDYGGTGRVAYVQKIMADLNASIVGFQEARTKGPAIRSMSCFWVIASGATHEGTHGCELWVARSIPSTTGHMHDIRRDCIAITSHSHRHLLVAIRAPALCIDCMVFHAPTSSAHPHEIRTFWKRIGLERDRARTKSSTPLVVMADINGRLGSITSSSVGGLAPDREDLSGSLFHDLMRKEGLLAPSTFHHGFTGNDHNTFVSTQGNTCRIDFVAFPIRWHHNHILTRVCSDVAIGEGRVDHIPVVSVVDVINERGFKPCRRRATLCDRKKLSDPTRIAGFVNDMEHCPIVPWATPAEDHYRTVLPHIQEAAARHFPIEARAPRSPIISPQSWTLMCIRASYRKAVKVARADLDVARMRAVIVLWRYVGVGCRYDTHVVLQDARTHDAHMVQLDVSCAYLWHMFMYSNARVRTSIRQDKQDSIDKLAVEASVAADAHDHKTVFRVVRILAGPKAPGVPSVRMDDGTLAPSYERVCALWQQYFQGLLHGSMSSFDAEATKAIPHNRRLFSQVAQAGYDSSTVPSLKDMVALFGAHKRDRAFGEVTRA